MPPTRRFSNFGQSRAQPPMTDAPTAQRMSTMLSAELLVDACSQSARTVTSANSPASWSSVMGGSGRSLSARAARLAFLRSRLPLPMGTKHGCFPVADRVSETVPVQRRWTRAIAMAIVLASLLACSSDGAPTSDASTAPGATVVIRTDGASDPRTTAPTAPDGSASNAPSPTTSDAVSPAPAPVVPTPGGPGSFATRYLRPSSSSRITVAALVQSGATPQAGTLAHVQSVLQQASGKPVEITTIAVADGARRWTSNELAAMADGNAPSPTLDTAVLSLLFVHGDFGGD
ncbi:MAG: hypothetical protein QOE63_637, partial [Acidimicrobiaceae bacterium]